MPLVVSDTRSPIRFTRFLKLRHFHYHLVELLGLKSPVQIPLTAIRKMQCLSAPVDSRVQQGGKCNDICPVEIPLVVSNTRSPIRF